MTAKTIRKPAGTDRFFTPIEDDLIQRLVQQAAQQAAQIVPPPLSNTSTK